ncbi:MAG: GyrI-like domain-containing protein [Candidatus Zixiibacteriota bacterium]
MKIQKVSIFLLLIFFLIIISCGQKEEKKTEPQLEIKVKTTEKINFLYLENTGPYWELTPVFQELGQYTAQKGITGIPMGIFYDDPSVVSEESLRCEIGMPVPEDFEPDPPFKVKELPSQEVAFAVLKGSYAEIAKEYGKIMQWIQENGYMMIGPPREIYLIGGEGVPESEYITEVQFPIAKSS